MKRVISLFMLLAIVTLGVNAQNKGPVMKMDETKHSFGEVTEGEKARHEFHFTNDGKEPLILTNVKASCGCTTPEWPREPIMPGQRAKVTAVYNSKGRPGRFNKSITITSNDVTQPTRVVYIDGTVIKPPTVVPGEKEKSMMSAD